MRGAVLRPRLERRVTDRQETVVNRARIQWWDGVRIRCCRARLLEISTGGASLLSERPIPSAETIWIQLRAPVQTDWVTARVVWRNERNKLGVRFRQSCPVLTHALTLGIDSSSLFGP
jgi:hypothetical protein